MNKENLLDKVDFSGLSFNSKTIKKNEVFIAVKGSVTDGILFAQEAVKNGASAIVCDKKSIVPHDLLELLKQKNIPLIKVKNPEITASVIAKKLYPLQPKYIFAITGTNGKTTITDLTEQLLNLMGLKETATLGTMGFQSRNKKFKSLKNKINEMIGINPLTTVDTITMHKILEMSQKAGIKYLILEASSDGIMRHRINEIDITSCGLINISEDHLITHGTMKNYVDTKFSLFSYLANNKFAVFNNDDSYSKQLTKYLNKLSEEKKIKIIKFGITTENNEIQITNIKPIKNGFNIDIQIYGKKYSTNINMIGIFQLYNLMNAIGFVLSVIPKKEIKTLLEILKKVKTVNGRMELINKTKKGADVYLDYAHNPSSLENALLELRRITKGKIISVTGISSGKSESRNETARIAGMYADIVIFTYISPRSETTDEMIAKQQKIYPKGLHGGQTRYDAIKKAIDMAQEGDSILINGQGHERFIVEYGNAVTFYDPDAVNDIILKSEY
ncbi:MAG: UDP-N-acetylmuramyl-tripeptide synthetase [Treponema sp.]|nr:UDP-N-acetylmuramyl-tripeptide synthetase [Treponema sp.]MCL2251493.1 UDP-N-acetylmuramyl-tripeptide synthetase [Treponema sp.]